MPMDKRRAIPRGWQSLLSGQLVEPESLRAILRHPCAPFIGDAEEILTRRIICRRSQRIEACRFGMIECYAATVFVKEPEIDLSVRQILIGS